MCVERETGRGRGKEYLNWDGAVDMVSSTSTSRFVIGSASAGELDFAARRTANLTSSHQAKGSVYLTPTPGKIREQMLLWQRFWESRLQRYQSSRK